LQQDYSFFIVFPLRGDDIEKIGWQYLKAAAILVCMTMLMAGIWATDISVSAMVVSSKTGEQIILTSGWWNRSPIIQYHIGLYMVYISSLIISLIAIYEVLRKP